MFHDSCTSWRLLARQIRSHLFDIEQLSDENPSQSGSLGLPILDLDIKVVSDKSLISHRVEMWQSPFSTYSSFPAPPSSSSMNRCRLSLASSCLVVVLQISDDLLPLVDNVSEIPFPL